MKKLPIIFILPLTIYLLLFLLYPSLYAAKVSLTTKTGQFTLSNFIFILKDPIFWIALRNNIIVPIGSVIFELLVGLGIALLVSREFFLRGTVRTIAILPFAVPEIVFLTIMRFIFAEHGYLNAGLLGMGLPQIDWLAPNSWLSLVVIGLADAWHVTPIVFLIILSGIESIPRELYEAARIDGASGWNTFTRITLPLLTPFMISALILRSIDAFRIFATPLVLTGFEGAPFISTYAYHFWSDYSNGQIANGAGLILALMMLSLSYIYLKIWRKAEVVGI